MKSKRTDSALSSTVKTGLVVAFVVVLLAVSSFFVFDIDNLTGIFGNQVTLEQTDGVAELSVSDKQDFETFKVDGPTGSTKTLGTAGESIRINDGTGQYTVVGVLQNGTERVLLEKTVNMSESGSEPTGVSGSVEIGDLSGNGTVETPYQVSNDQELQAIRNGLNANYTLTRNITLTNTDQWNDGSGFNPIGNNSRQFNGSFNGNGHVIYSPTIRRGDTDAIGLFGSVSSDGTIENFAVTNTNIDGRNDIGGLIGINDGNVSNVFTTGRVSGDKGIGGLVGKNRGSVQYSYSRSLVVGDADNVGGGIGVNRGTVQTSFASGDTYGRYLTGGLIGNNNDGIVSDSFATGDVYGVGTGGGLAGGNNGLIVNAYATGNVTLNRSYAGGLVGNNDLNGEISKTYATGTVTAGDKIGGLVGLMGSQALDSGERSVLNNSYYDSQMTGESQAVGAVKDGDGEVIQERVSDLDTVSMQGSDNRLESFDFSENWSAVDGEYPVVQTIGEQAQIIVR